MKLRRRRDRPEPLHAYRRSPEVTIRWARPEDRARLAVLAELDETRIPPAPLLLGFVGDELWVAVSLSTGAAVTDPFRPSAEVALLVTERGRQLTVSRADQVRSTLPRLRRQRSLQEVS